MAIIKDHRNVVLHGATGHTGKPNGLGEMVMGFSYVGQHGFYLGCYQRRLTREGYRISKQIYIIPIDPKTAKQKQNRYRYRNFSLIYNNLSQFQKDYLKTLSKGTRLNGQNLYLKKAIINKPTYLGAFILGENNISDLTIS